MAANDLFTLLDIATEVSQNYGDTSDITIAKAKKWVNRALMRISEMGTWSWQKVYDEALNTVAGTETYTLADGVKKINAIWIQGSTRRKLRLIEDRRFREIFTQPTTPQGTPLYYRNYGRDATSGEKKIAIYPVPNAVYALKYDYDREIQMLVDNTDDVRVETGMPAHMIDALIELATAIGYRELDDSDYESAMAEALERWRALFADDSSEIDDRIRQAPFEADGPDLNDPVLPSNYS